MKQRLLILLAIFPITFSLAQDSSSKEEIVYWMKFKAPDREARTQIAELGVTIEAIVEDSVMALGRESELESAKKSGMLEVSFPLTGKMLDFPNYDSLFHNYEELTVELEKIAAEYPDLIHLSSAGKSLEQRDLWLVTIGDINTHQNKPGVFFMGGHHAREHLSVEIPLKFIRHMAKEYNSGNERIRQLVDNRAIYVLPIVNPDGSEHDIASGKYRLWRKNRRNNGGSFGVDLNRNYGFQWGGGGASTNPSSDTFRGPTAFSEPETQIVRDFFRSHDNITTALTFHTFSKLILYPWGHKYDSISEPKDLAVHETMARRMAQWNGYTPQQSSGLYIASGDTTDWAYGELKVISFTFELDPEMGNNAFNPEKGFYPGQAFIEPTFAKNLEPMLYLLDYADNPYRVLEPNHAQFGLKSALVD